MYSTEIEKLTEALRLSPDNIIIEKILAEKYLEEWFIIESENKYKEIIEKEPDNLALRLKLVEIFIINWKTDEAESILDYLIEKNTFIAESNIFKSKIYLEKLDYKKANDFYREWISINENLKDSNFEEIIKSKLEFNDVGELLEDDYELWEWLFYKWEKTKFEDVWWLEDLKEKIRLKVIYPIEQEDIYKKYWKKIWWWILLYWPPWCWKTFIARAIAWELNSKFIHVWLTDIFDMYSWESEKNLKKIFDIARRNKPCVIFFDEVDALGSKRSDNRWDWRHIVNQFLMELDWIKEKNDWLLVIWATNAPWYMDSAFKRPWRFDNIIFVWPPDEKSREEIFKVKLSDKPIWDIDYSLLAKKSVKLSWADIDLVIDNTLESKIKDSLKTLKISNLETNDLLKEIKNINPSTIEWFSTAKNYATYSNESWIYDDILKY